MLPTGDLELMADGGVSCSGHTDLCADQNELLETSQTLGIPG